MFLTIIDPVDIYDKPSLSGNVVGQIGKDQQVNVIGTPVSADGWIWHEVEGGGLWVIERSADGNRLLLTMIWQGEGSPPTVPGLETAHAFPPQPADFTNQMLLDAFQHAAQSLGAPDSVNDWLEQAQLTWLPNVAGEFYEGTPIAELPGLDDEIKLTVLAKLNNLIDTQVTINNVDLTAPPSGGKFTTKGTQFLLNGKPFRFVGVNVRELAYYGFPGWGHGQFTRPEHIDLQLQTAQAMRAQVFRMYAPYNLNAKGKPGTDAKEAIKRLKVVLDKAEKLNMYALITLDDAKQSGFNVSADNAKYREPGFVSNIDFYISGYKEQYIPFVREVVGALGGHPALFAWGIANESQINPFVPPTPPKAHNEAFLSYYKHTSELIRSLAPNDLITTSIESAHHLFVVNAYEQGKYANQLYGLPTIDFATIHSYQDKLRMDNVLGHNAEKGTQALELAHTSWKIPVVIEEMGPVGGKNRGGGGDWVRGALAEWFRLGAAGCMQWAFSAADGDIGVGDADSGMHNVGAGHPGLPGHDWDAMFAAYKFWGDQFWVD